MTQTADEILYGWVQDLGLDLWLGAPVVFVPTDKVVPTKNDFKSNVLLRLNKVMADKIKDPILVVHSEGQFLLRDGHYRWMLALLNRKNLLQVHMIETDDEVEHTGHNHPGAEECRSGCQEFEEPVDG